MMILQHSSVRKSLYCYVTLLKAKVGIFSLSYAAIPSFLGSVLFIDSYFIFKCINILVIYISEVAWQIFVTEWIKVPFLVRKFCMACLSILKEVPTKTMGGK